jgi:hypothetical protein
MSLFSKNQTTPFQGQAIDLTRPIQRQVLFTSIEALVALLCLTPVIFHFFRFTPSTRLSFQNVSKKVRLHGSLPVPAQLPEPFSMPLLKTGMSQKMTMGLKRLDKTNWLHIDHHYQEEHTIRARNLDNHKSAVLQCLPGSEAACHELLDHVTSFLAERYPQSFTISQDGKNIINHLTNETFLLGAANPEPLETATRLAMEDFNVLVKDEEGSYRLLASATLFPAGWKLEERIGGTMADLHAPVPKWQEKLGSNVDRLVSAGLG